MFVACLERNILFDQRSYCIKNNCGHIVSSNVLVLAFHFLCAATKDDFKGSSLLNQPINDVAKVLNLTDIGPFGNFIVLEESYFFYFHDNLHKPI